MDLDDVADELYGLPPEEFTAARTLAERAARESGDRELAASIKRLGRPTTVGWLANQLVRSQGDDVRSLLELGGDLRAATAAVRKDEVRELSRRQHRAVEALLAATRERAAAAGRRVTDDAARSLEQTLRAAVADEDLAARLLLGRLVDGLDTVGFGWPTTEPGPPPAPRARSTSPSGDAVAREALDRAEHALAAAEAAAVAAAAERATAQADVDGAAADATDATALVARLEAELDRATGERAAAEQALRRATSRLEQATETDQAAGRSLEDARAAHSHAVAAVEGSGAAAT